MEISSGTVFTNDGVCLHYTEAGAGPDMLLVSGWTLGTEIWRHQIEEFAQTHHVVAFDYRGHGRSERPTHGYRLARFAADTREVIKNLGLIDVTWVGHGLGVGVAWSYWDLFGGQDLKRFVLIDQLPAMVAQPDWPDDFAGRIGATLRTDTLAEWVSTVRGPQGEEAAADALSRMISPRMSDEDSEWILSVMMGPNRDAATQLLFDFCIGDWRDVTPLIDIPTLVLAGEIGLFDVAPVAASMPGATVRVVSAADRGSHMMIWENPGLVNQLIRDFLAGH